MGGSQANSMVTSSLPSTSPKDIDFGIWLDTHQPTTVTEELRLVLVEPILEWVATRCKDQQRNPTPKEEELLHDWLTSWDWSDHESNYKRLMLNSFMKPPYQMWMSKLSHEHPKLGLMWAVYGALQIDTAIQARKVPGQNVLKVNLHNIVQDRWTNFLASITPSFKSEDALAQYVDTNTFSYVNYVLESATLNGILTISQRDLIKATYSMQQSIFKSTTAESLLTIMSSVETVSSCELPLPNMAEHDI